MLICKYEFKCFMKRKSNELFLLDLKLINPNVLPLEEYTMNNIPILCKCLICGHEWKVRPSNLLSKKGCPNCKKIKLSKEHQYTTEDFIKKALKIHNNKYDYSKVNYIDCFTPVTIICPIHGEFQLIPSSHLNSRGCAKCANNIKKTTELFIKEALAIHGDKYNYNKVNYISAHTKVCIICLEHGEFWLEPANHLAGKGCPKCNKSKGELFIENFLKTNNIIFVPLYSININMDINPSGIANIDFYISNKNLFIEYNGELHYIPKNVFGGEIRFNIQQRRDTYVREYCKENNINLLEIPYNKTWDEITEILNTTLL